MVNHYALIFSHKKYFEEEKLVFSVEVGDVQTLTMAPTVGIFF